MPRVIRVLRVRLSIRRKLLCVCGGLAGVTALVGGWGILAFSGANAAFQVAVNESLPAVDHLLRAAGDLQQALVIERSLLFMSASSPSAKAVIAKHAAQFGQVDARWKTYTAIPATPDERTRQPEFEAALAEWAAASRDVVQLLAQDTPDARRDAIDLSMGEGAEKFAKADRVLTALTELRVADARRQAATQARRAVHTRWWTLAVVIASVSLAVGLALVMARAVARPLEHTVALLRDIARGEGDLTRRLEVSTQDEIGQLSTWFNRFMERLEEIIRQAARSAHDVMAASQGLSTATSHLSRGAQAQAAALEETAASLEEITGTVKQNADNAKQASQLALGSRDVADKGDQVVSAAVRSMSEINASSRKIADIITTIDEIAFQTNLLALNAAVEAARAGEQGRGFAVVATEVRNLAQRSATAANEIKALIQDSVAKVESGAALVNTSGQTLQEIVASVKRMTDIIAEIAAASSEQSTGIDQVNKAVTQMDEVTQSNATQTDELSSTAQALAAQARQLEELVGQFKVSARAEAPTATPVAKHPAVAPAPATIVVPGTLPRKPVMAGVNAGSGSSFAKEHVVAEF
jgi:methyl-accepting chemotaxis protein